MDIEQQKSWVEWAKINFNQLPASDQARCRWLVKKINSHDHRALEIKYDRILPVLCTPEDINLPKLESNLNVAIKELDLMKYQARTFAIAKKLKEERIQNRAPQKKIMSPMKAILDKLNGWQRVGLALSVLWLLMLQILMILNKPTGLHFNDGDDNQIFWESSFGMADRVALKISKSNLNADLKDLQLMDDVSKDEKERITSELIADYKVEEQVFFDSLSPNWLNIILASLLPIIAGWCLISPLIRLIRWINAGFQKNDKH